MIHDGDIFNTRNDLMASNVSFGSKKSKSIKYISVMYHVHHHASCADVLTVVVSGSGSGSSRHTVTHGSVT